MGMKGTLNKNGDAFQNRNSITENIQTWVRTIYIGNRHEVQPIIKNYPHRSWRKKIGSAYGRPFSKSREV